MCLYADGYTQQEVFWCKSCSPAGNCALCTECKDECHRDCVDVVSLGEKFHIRCDCALCGNKPVNDQNQYNHNFVGMYCHCNQPDDGSPMTQCVLCSDWFHDLCLLVEVQPTHDLICLACLQNPKHRFLFPYFFLSVDDLLLNKPVRHQAIVDVVNNRDITVGCEWRLALCECHACMRLHESAQTMHLFHGLDFDAATASVMTKLPLELAATFGEGYILFRDRLNEIIASKPNISQQGIKEAADAAEAYATSQAGHREHTLYE